MYITVPLSTDPLTLEVWNYGLNILYLLFVLSFGYKNTNSMLKFGSQVQRQRIFQCVACDNQC
jgi:hypothetical protein